MPVSGSNVISSAIGISIPQQNNGKTEYKGIDLGIDWKDKVGKDFTYYVGGTLNYIRTEVIENGEGYIPYDYLSGKGLPDGQLFGLEAIGYFGMKRISPIVLNRCFRKCDREISNTRI